MAFKCSFYKYLIGEIPSVRIYVSVHSFRYY